jgi:hypothetical protein
LFLLGRHHGCAGDCPCHASQQVLLTLSGID